MAQPLGRAQFCDLCDIDVEALNALYRRDLVPAVQEKAERVYTPAAAFVLTVADEFSACFALSRDRAALMASSAYDLIGSRWKDIAATSEAMLAEKTSTGDILVGAVNVTNAVFRRAEPTMVIGTLAEIAARYPKAVNLIVISATRCATLLRQRARRHKIDVDSLWRPDGFKAGSGK